MKCCNPQSWLNSKVIINYCISRLQDVVSLQRPDAERILIWLWRTWSLIEGGGVVGGNLIVAEAVSCMLDPWLFETSFSLKLSGNRLKSRPKIIQPLYQSLMFARKCRSKLYPFALKGYNLSAYLAAAADNKSWLKRKLSTGSVKPGICLRCQHSPSPTIIGQLSRAPPHSLDSSFPWFWLR